MILSRASSETCLKTVIFGGSEGETHSVPEGAKVSLIFLILLEKRRQTGQPMAFQTRGMEVWHQKPYSRFYAAHAIFFESHDYCLKSVCCNSLIYFYLQVPCTEQSDNEADFYSVDF